MSPEDRNIDLITRWLTGQTELTADGLSEEGAEAVEELMLELRRSDVSRGHLHMLARETLEALAMAG